MYVEVNFDIYIKISGIYEWEGLIKMKIIKRSGSEVTFDITKIMAAVSKANQEVFIVRDFQMSRFRQYQIMLRAYVRR